jgi:serine/threonine protein phosphatase PrpC
MVVADGMGGHYYGEIAAQIAVQTLTDSFQREANPGIPDPFLFPATRCSTRTMRHPRFHRTSTT